MPRVAVFVILARQSEHNILCYCLRVLGSLSICLSVCVCLKLPSLPTSFRVVFVVRESAYLVTFFFRRGERDSGVATMLGTLAIVASLLVQHVAAHGGCLNYTVGDTWYPG